MVSPSSTPDWTPSSRGVTARVALRRIRLHVHLTDAALHGAEPAGLCWSRGPRPRHCADRSEMARPKRCVCHRPACGAARSASRRRLRDPASNPRRGDARHPPASTPGHRVPDRQSTWTTPPPTLQARRAARPGGVGTLGPLAPKGAPAQDGSATSKSAARDGRLPLAQPPRLAWLVADTGTHSLGRGPGADAFLASRPHREPNRRPNRAWLVLEPARRSPPIDLIHPSAKAQHILRTNEHRRYREGMRWTRTITVVDSTPRARAVRSSWAGCRQSPGRRLRQADVPAGPLRRSPADDLVRAPGRAPPQRQHLVASSNPDAQMGYIILESTEYPAMSGSNTIGRDRCSRPHLPMSEPTTELTLESPAGLITVSCRCRGRQGRAGAVRQ